MKVSHYMTGLQLRCHYNFNFHSLFITSWSTFRLIKALIKKDFLSMSHSLHTANAHHFEKIFKMVGISSVKAM